MTIDTSFIDRLNRLAAWLESQGATQPILPMLDEQGHEYPAYRWKSGRLGSTLIPIARLPQVRLDDLIGIDYQKKQLIRNTEFFLQGYPANNVLLTGARGTGKSSLVRALLNRYYVKGLRVIETDKEAIADWHSLISALHHRCTPTVRYILYCDDLSFEEGEWGYKVMKSLLDGGFETLPPHVCIYASSNRRHLLPEYQHENLAVQHIEEEIHPGDMIEEKISLSERFGLWLSFYPVTQDHYWKICYHWLHSLGMPESHLMTYHDDIRAEALRWALTRGARNGRIAEQFACDAIAQWKSHHA